jgi:hypothetical protein
MKKITLILLSFSLLFISSCSKENEGLKNQTIIQKQLPESLLKIINEKKLSNQNLVNRNGNNVRFDYDNISETYNDKEGVQIFTANQYGFDTKNSLNYGECYFLENGKVVDNMILGTENISNDVKIVHHFDEDWNEFLALQLTNSTKEVKQVLIASRNAQCTGANVMGCITDSYSNHGWVSAWAFVQTAFIPQTAAAIAVVCAIKNKC